MYFEKLTMENYRCYESETVEFEPGVTIIYGRNGSGKSTILEACFFALYGSGALQENDSNLEDIITTGEDTTRVSLRFRHEGDEYTVKREVRERSGRVTQAICELDTPDETLSGATDVDAKIFQLVRMDEAAFLNCAYIQQGDIEQFINADAAEREALIDNLLQLGRLEEYAERADNIRIGVDRVLRSKRELLEEKKTELEEKARERPWQQLKQINEQISTLDEEREEKNQQLEELETALEELEETKREYEDTASKLDDVREDIESVEEAVDDLEDEKQTAIDEVETYQERLKECRRKFDQIEDGIDLDIPDEDTLAELRKLSSSVTKEKAEIENKIREKETEISNSKEEIKRINTEIADKKDRIDKLESKIQDKNQRIESKLEPNIEDLKEEIATIESDIEGLKAEIQDTTDNPSNIESQISTLEEEREELVSERTDISSDIKTLEREIEESEELISEGKCPKCGQDIDESGHGDNIDDLQSEITDLKEEYESLGDEIQSIDDQLEALNQALDSQSEIESLEDKKSGKEDLLEQTQSTIEDLSGEIDDHNDEIVDIQSEIEEKRGEIPELKDDIDSSRKEVEGHRAELETLEGREEKVGDLLQVAELQEDIERSIEKGEDEIERTENMLEEKEQRHNELLERRDDLESQLEGVDLEEVETEIDEVESAVDEVESEIEGLQEQKENLKEERGGVQGTIESIESIEDAIARLGREIEALKDLSGQMERVEQMYTQLRGDLRVENIRKLEHLLNEIFDSVNQTGTYERIELDDHYTPTIIEKTNNSLEPSKLSGGESALFNICLRCAIYQLLVEGLGDTALLPPLILDEPTVYLDSGHVGEIDSIVRRMRDIGVEQTIVVSHNDELTDTPNHRIEVIQDTATNRSEAVAEKKKLLG